MSFQYDHDNVKVSPLASAPSLYKAVKLLNGSSDSMNVNGSVTPVSFTFSPLSGEVWYVSSVSIYIEDGAGSSSEFGAIAALTNGLLLQCQTNGVAMDICNSQSNIDLILNYPDMKVITSAAGLFGSTNVLYANMQLPHPNQLVLSGNTDYIRMRVRDNLTGVNQLKAKVFLWSSAP